MRWTGRRRVLALGVAAVLLGSTLVGVVVFPRAGHLIVREDPWTRAETALILSGDPVRRGLAARDLYRQGRIERIVLIPEPPDPIKGELVALGLVDPGLPSMSERILVASGVPRERIAFLPDPVDGTIQEAHAVRRFFDGRLPPRLVVITSKFASRRACFIFGRVLRPVEILCAPTPYDAFEPEQWWAKPRDALTVVMEYQKFFANALSLALGLDGD